MNKWDVSYTYSRSERNASIENLLNHDRLARALGPADQCTGDCVPFNLFGGQQGTGNAPGSGGSITPEMVDYVTYTALEQNEQEMVNWLANISGDLVDLPAGPLSFAAGFEKRREFAADTPDPLAQAGSGAASVSGGQRAPTSGRLNLEAWYAEVNVPILSDAPGADLLELSASVRGSDFEQFGSETTSRVGLRWRPYEDLLLRTSFAEGFRAPGVQELFGGQGVADPELNDPCSNFLDSGVSQEVIDNCIAQGVPDDGSYEQFNTQIRITSGGNPDLEPETSDSFTVGGVWSMGAWEAVWNVHYVHSYTEPCSDGLSPSFSELGLCSNPDPVNPTNRLGSTTYNDVQVSYFFDDFGVGNGKVSVGIDNVLDRDPPVSTAAFANSFDATQHRIPGQFYYARINVNF